MVDEVQALEDRERRHGAEGESRVRLRPGDGAEGALLRFRSTRRWPRHITLFSARSRLYRNEILQPKAHFATFFKIYKATQVSS